jgi:dolichyl-phosphate beta-glucosyltransferase
VLSVILPAYNQAEVIGQSVISLWGFLQMNFPDSEILVVDDGSTDATLQRAREATEGIEARVRLFRTERNNGKGAAVSLGVMHATREYVFFTDADLPYELEDLANGLDLLRKKGADMVVGDRDHRDSRILVKCAVKRIILKELFGLMAQVLVRTPCRDTQCGLKGFKAQAAGVLFSVLRVRGFCFDVELFAIAEAMGIKVERFPVTFVRDSTSSLRLLRDSLGMGLDLLKIAKRRRTGFYNDRLSDAQRVGFPLLRDRVY